MPLAADSLRRDLVSAYVASAAKVASWVVVTALVYRSNRGDYAMLALVRGTVGLLGYTALGLAPALVHAIANVRPRDEGEVAPPLVASPVLTYETPTRFREDPVRVVLSNGLFAAIACAGVGLVLTIAYASNVQYLHDLPTQWYRGAAGVMALWFGVGMVFRLLSDPYGAVLQTAGRIATDNVLLVGSELAWVVLYFRFRLDGSPMVAAGEAFAVSGGLLLVCRSIAANRSVPMFLPTLRLVDPAVIRQLLAFGGLVTVAQLADFLYAPTDYVLINRLLGANTVATYAPAVQIDGALLLVVGAIAGVLLPRAAAASAAGDVLALRKFYVRGTLISSAMLIAAAVATWLASPLIFRAWLGEHWAIPHTIAILPLLLIHTVVGGSSAVGRSILLGMGKVKPFATAVLIAGVSNVILSYCFVKFLHLGLKGIVFATIVAVVGRCAVWQPWYVMRCLRAESRPDVP